MSSDVAWALSFCLEQGFQLNTKAGRVLSTFDDDCIALQALHLAALGLIPKGFSTAGISRLLKECDLDREHWLIAYEAARQGFLKESEPAVKSNALFSDLFAHKISFYRTKLPNYASIVHPGGAPEWVVRKWMDVSVKPEGAAERMPVDAPIPKKIEDDLARLKGTPKSQDDAIAELLDLDESDVDLDDLMYPV